MEEEERQERIKKKREEKRIQAEVKNIILQKMLQSILKTKSI